MKGKPYYWLGFLLRKCIYKKNKKTRSNLEQKLIIKREEKREKIAIVPSLGIIIWLLILWDEVSPPSITWCWCLFCPWDCSAAVVFVPNHTHERETMCSLKQTPVILDRVKENDRLMARISVPEWKMASRRAIARLCQPTAIKPPADSQATELPATHHPALWA